MPFYWIDTPELDEACHLRRAVDALYSAIQVPGVRLWNPYSEALVKAGFKKRIQKAARGELRPPGEIKPIGDGRPPLYEIRWSGIDVRERPAEGGPDAYGKIEVRMIHAEPNELGLCFIGLHAHEKQCSGSPREIKAAQDSEIDAARHRFFSRQAEKWGVTKRTAG